MRERNPTTDEPVRRCGQCGRSYSGGRWRTIRSWCPHCTKYVCHDCTTMARICPTCGNECATNALGLAFGGLYLGGTFFIVCVLMLLQEGFSVPWVVMTVIMGSILGVGLFFVRELWVRKRTHSAFLLIMPPGVISPDERVNADDPAVAAKRDTALAEMGAGVRPLVDGIVPGDPYRELVGRWDFPVMSRQERIEYNRVVREKMRPLGIGPAALGVILLAAHVLVVQHQALCMAGSVTLFMGVMILVVGILSKRVVAKGAGAATKVSWKSIGYEVTIAALEEFLQQRGEVYTVESNTAVKAAMWKNPEQRFLLGNGTVISTMYTENTGSVYGWVAINYDPEQYEHARELQRELDAFLGERDLIQRVR